MREVDRLDTDEGIGAIQRMIEKCYSRSLTLWKDINGDKEEEDKDDEVSASADTNPDESIDEAASSSNESTSSLSSLSSEEASELSS